MIPSVYKLAISPRPRHIEPKVGVPRDITEGALSGPLADLEMTRLPVIPTLISKIDLVTMLSVAERNTPGQKPSHREATIDASAGYQRVFRLAEPQVSAGCWNLTVT